MITVETMKLTILLLIIVGAMATVCASARAGLVLAPVAPSGSRVASGAGRGFLVVLSAVDPNPSFNARGFYRQHYCDYKILAEDGRFRQLVHNDPGTIFQDPLQVTLPAANCRVLANANSCGSVNVPVRIVSRRLTTDELDDEVSMARLATRY